MPRHNKAVAEALQKRDIDDLKKVVEDGFKGVHERQDTTNGKVLRNSEDILLLKASKWYERGIAGVVTVLVGIVVYFLTK